jgi:carbon monoxide dehydrogenase subunit G
MSRIDNTIDVNVPVRVAYNQWTQFEDFPHFMEGVERVEQLDDRTLEWTASIGGQTRSWQARIVDQVPDERIAWVSTSGAQNDGIVTFLPLDADRTRVNLAIEVRPEGPVENIGAAVGLIADRVGGDLARFRDFIERRGVETGAWRGTIPDDTTAADPASSSTTGVRSGGTPDPRMEADDEATGRGFAEGLADPAVTRQPVSGGTPDPRMEADDEATGRGFAEGLADPAVTRQPVSGGTPDPRMEADDEATGRGFAEGLADPAVTREGRGTTATKRVRLPQTRR